MPENFIQIPSVTTLQRDSIVDPQVGYTVYNTDINQLEFFNGATWVNVGSSKFTLESGSTAARPAVPTLGYTRYNTDTKQLEVYDGVTWANAGASKFLTVPRYAGGEDDPVAIENRQPGMMRYNDDKNTIEIWNGEEWADSTAITSKYIQIPSARNDLQYPRNARKGSMVYNETTQKVDVKVDDRLNGDWRPGVNVPLMRRIQELPDMFDPTQPQPPDGNDYMIIEQAYEEFNEEIGAPQTRYRTFKTSLDDFYHGEFFDSIWQYYWDQKTTADLPEDPAATFDSGTMYFTFARARAAISVETEQPYFGYIYYDPAEGVIHYKGTDEADVRGSISFEYGDLARYDQESGVFTFPGEFDDPYFNSVRVRTVFTDHITFTGTGPVALESGSDIVLNPDGFIRLKKPTTIPAYTVAELEDLALEALLGTVVYCTDPEIGGPRPVIWNGSAWKDFLNGDIYDIENDI